MESKKITNEIYSLISELKEKVSFLTYLSEPVFDHILFFDLGMFNIPKIENDKLNYFPQNVIGISSFDIYDENEKNITIYYVYSEGTDAYDELTLDQLILLKEKINNIKNKINSWELNELHKKLFS